MSWAELPPQLEEAKQFGITRNICDFILPWRMRGVAGQRGQGAGQHQSSFVLYKCNGRRWGIKCRSWDSMRLVPFPWPLRNVSKQKALHTFRQQAKYKLNFLLKDKGKFCRAARVRAGMRRWVRERRGERVGESRRVRARHCRRLLFCRKMKILIPSGLSAQRPMRPVVVEVGSEVTVNRTSPGGR